MIEDLFDLNALTANDAASVVAMKVAGLDRASRALTITEGQLAVRQGMSIPVVAGRSSLTHFIDANPAKVSALLADDVAPKSELADGVYFAGALNYYHFMVFQFANLLWLKSSPDRTTVRVYTRHWIPSFLKDFVDRSLPTLSGGRPVDVVPIDDGDYALRRIIFPTKPDIAVVAHVCGRIVPAMAAGSAHASHAGFGRKLFVRRSSDHRRLMNENEVADWLAARGYDAIDPGALPFETQVAVFAQATHIVGVEGAAMTNILFAAKAVHLVMLANPVTAAEPFFPMLAKYGPVQMSVITCEPRRIGADLRNADFVLPPSRFGDLVASERGA